MNIKSHANGTASQSNLMNYHFLRSNTLFGPPSMQSDSAMTATRPSNVASVYSNYPNAAAAASYLVNNSSNRNASSAAAAAYRNSTMSTVGGNHYDRILASINQNNSNVSYVTRPNSSSMNNPVSVAYSNMYDTLNSLGYATNSSSFIQQHPEVVGQSTPGYSSAYAAAASRSKSVSKYIYSLSLSVSCVLSGQVLKKSLSH